MKAKAKDNHGAESNWSDPLLVSMPVEIEFTQTEIPNPVVDVQESEINPVIEAPASSTTTSSSSDSTTQSATDEPIAEESTVDRQEKNIFDFIQLLLRLFRGAYKGMTLQQVFRMEGLI
jgi:hypothetical protein